MTVDLGRLASLGIAHMCLLRQRCRLWAGGLNRSTQHLEQLAINNDDGLPNRSPKCFQRVPPQPAIPITGFALPPSYHHELSDLSANNRSLPSKGKCCVDRLSLQVQKAKSVASDRPLHPALLKEARAAATKSGCFENGCQDVFSSRSAWLFQIECVEAFGKPAVDRREKIAGLLPLALIAPEPRHGHCRAVLLRRFCRSRAQRLPVMQSDLADFP